MPLPQRLRPVTRPVANPAAVVTGPNWRITVLTERLLRLEWSDSGEFEDRATQVVWNRDFPEARYELVRSGDGVELTTRGLRLSYDGQRFSGAGLVVRQPGRGGHAHVWSYGSPPVVGPHDLGNLGGTARTLDDVDGPTPLGTGLLSTFGWATLDDSQSLALTDDGWVDQRVGDLDLYLFLHDTDAAAALRDFYALTGEVPLLPRWALGNWWSRYHPYSADEYERLMDRFAAEGLPFSVAVLDMDWHWVDIDAAHGSGWTGFSWNTGLFPDPDVFLARLRARGLRVSLNLHPADGVRSYEDAYPRLAARLGLDAAAKAPIPFAVDDPDFMQAYLEEVLHPLEDAGVDVWWLDWQQGTTSAIPGLDPLWLLNHLHFLDSARRGRALTFSRYAGPGSHRYPIGFSGDAVTSWASLDFQPYFTATASNIGYGWWSHDIGGHMFGVRDDELTARWFQLGVFSPINRLHSTASLFQGKEPWNYAEPAASVMRACLRLRHRLIPYLHTMNERAHRLGEPLVRPLYHEDPRVETVRHGRNAFRFGTALLVAPLTTPAAPRTRCASVTTWLPEGDWIDWYTGLRYAGGRMVTFHRPLDQYPVLARAGAIVPLTGGDDLGVENPAHLHLRVFTGADGEFVLYEDDDAGAAARTRFTWDDRAGVLTIDPVTGGGAVVPDERVYTVSLTGLAPTDVADVDTRWDAASATLSVEVGAVASAQGATFRLQTMPTRGEQQLDQRLFTLLHGLQVEQEDKHAVWAFLQANPTTLRRLMGLPGLPVAEDIKAVLTELLLADPEPDAGGPVPAAPPRTGG